MNCNTYSGKTSGGDQEPITYSLIAEGNLYGDGAEGITAQKIVITANEEWQTLISKMNTVNDESKNFSEIKIDFTKYIVIAVFDNIKSNGGHSISLDIDQSTDKIIVHTTYNSPQGMAITIMAQPYIIVKIRKTDLPVVFE